jgi:hypothetical protein
VANIRHRSSLNSNQEDQDMKKLATITAAALLTSGVAFAQGADINAGIPGDANERAPERVDNPRVPAYQRGDNSEAGGPAKELQRNSGRPLTTGTVRERTFNDSNKVAPERPDNAIAPNRGDAQESGGPARALRQ